MSEQQKSTIFLAGATGAIGRPLCRQLVEAGWPDFSIAPPRSSINGPTAL